MVIDHQFFNRDTLIVAEELLGKFLCTNTKRYMITEVEAYKGEDDPASHASIGKTTRNRVMYNKPGYIYVYLIYGMYYCFNIVTEEEGVPAAVLIRGVSDIEDKTQAKKLDGPGKLCRELCINKSYNNKVLGEETGLWVEDAGNKVGAIKKKSRVGIKKGQEKLWRFHI